jgi:hypothetical protein
MSLLAFLLAQEEAADVAQEGKRIIIAMLITGLIFVAVIVIGQTLRYFGDKRRRKAHRATRAH